MHPVQIVPEMTCYVSGETFNITYSLVTESSSVLYKGIVLEREQKGFCIFNVSLLASYFLAKF